jgi:MFS transporter, YQGE family, putative transporter
MNRLSKELAVFRSHPHNMRVLILTNLIYALVMPVIEIFIGAYVMRNSGDVKMVVVYQLAVYTGIPATFLLNGWLLQRVGIARLYSLGMLMSGVSLTVMMSLGELTITGLGIAGFLMGTSFGLYWSNRDFLALSSTNDNNRNYYYGLETFFSTNIGIVVPFMIGAFIAASGKGDWLGGDANRAYQIITGVVILLTIASSWMIHRGDFRNPPKTRFIYLRSHPLWLRMQGLAVLKGLAQGYIVTAPAMLIMKLVGQEGTIGLIQSAGGVLAAALLYVVGRVSKPHHRIYIFAAGLLLFAFGALPNAILFSKIGVLIFMACLILARPLQDIAYFTIQMLVIDTLSAIEKRNEFSYILSQEAGFYVGRFTGCMLFIVLAFQVSDTFALRYALLIVGALQLISIPVAKGILAGIKKHAPPPTDTRVAEDVLEFR